jgi:hypothetical protein
MPEDSTRPTGSAASQRVALTVFTVAALASTAVLALRLPARPAWVRPVFVVSDLGTLVLVFWVLRRLRRRRDEANPRHP